MEHFECMTCGKMFTSPKRDKRRVPKYCCMKCFQNRIKTAETIKKMSDAKVGRIPWNKGVRMWEGKEHPRGTLGKPSKKRGRTVSEETRKKLKQSHYGIKYPGRSGDKSHFWKGGVTEPNMKIRKSSDYNTWRRNVLERDKFTCVLCLKRGGTLNADHILPFSTHPNLRLDLDNGRTLCIECHLKTETFGARMHKKSGESLLNKTTS